MPVELELHCSANTLRLTVPDVPPGNWTMPQVTHNGRRLDMPRAAAGGAINAWAENCQTQIPGREDLLSQMRACWTG